MSQFDKVSKEWFYNDIDSDDKFEKFSEFESYVHQILIRNYNES